MKKVIRMGVLALGMLFMVTAVHAQKYGYVNSAAILAELPQVKQMRSNLESYGSVLQKKGQQLLTDYQTKEQEAIQKQEAGQLSPLEQQTILEELQNKQQEIMAFEQEMQQKMLEKEQELLQPILDQVTDAINSVAKENGYTFVFDASSGAILYADETSDLTEKVKAKL